MAQAAIMFFDNVDSFGVGAGAQCFDGFCNQDRVDVAVPAAWPGAAQAAVATSGTAANYAVIDATGPVLVYCGPSTDPAVWAARAVAYRAGWWPMIARPGYVVAIKDGAS